jgi:hypothetical protein
MSKPPRDRIAGAEVDGDDVRADARGADAFGDSLETLATARDQRHVGALERELERRGGADAAGGPGDEHALADECGHRFRATRPAASHA